MISLPIFYLPDDTSLIYKSDRCRKTMNTCKTHISLVLPETAGKDTQADLFPNCSEILFRSASQGQIDKNLSF